MLGYYAQGIIYGGTVLLGGGLRSLSAFLVIDIIITVIIVVVIIFVIILTK